MLLIIGHQGVQVQETCSNVSSPVAVDTQSALDFNQLPCSIHLIALVLCFQVKEAVAIWR